MEDVAQTTPPVDMGTPPISTPPSTPPPTPMPQAPTTQMGTGDEGSGDDTLMGTLKSFNWIEIGFGILGTAALLAIIQYYRYSLNQQKAFQLEVQNKIDDLEIKYSDLKSVEEKSSAIVQPFS
jgi:hypothetical protein